MAGEYFVADTNKEYWLKLKAFYEASSPNFQEISKEEYENLNRSEREDSDNHINQDRLGEDTKAVDVTFYKYLPEQKTAFRSHIVDIDGNEEEHYFIIDSTDLD
ncbi:hypothetical protein GF376_00310 [Candidatus Peregrinibacteria bacterium]|nr:hypothetical protein [Candidatus Peregrinibacteria bacterium]